MKTENSILRTLAYFDMFRYPVTAEEIRLFVDQPATITEAASAMEELIRKKMVFRFDDLYLLHDDRSIVHRRRKGNERADELLQIAYRIGGLLGRFPFVRGVGISGSLSKNYAEEDADIDFFIITAANRLWIARTLLHCLKKLSFLTGKQHWYCMNYFIDEEALLIAEENIFTATEVVTLKPVYGEKTIDDFFTANNWALNYFPNYRLSQSIMANRHEPWYKKILEKLFGNRFGTWLDNYLMRITSRRWTQKEKDHQLNVKGDPISLLISKHFARPNPVHLQKKILGMFEDKLNDIQKNCDIQFDIPATSYAAK